MKNYGPGGGAEAKVAMLAAQAEAVVAALALHGAAEVVGTAEKALPAVTGDFTGVAWRWRKRRSGRARW